MALWRSWAVRGQEKRISDGDGFGVNRRMFMLQGSCTAILLRFLPKLPLSTLFLSAKFCLHSSPSDKLLSFNIHTKCLSPL